MTFFGPDIRNGVAVGLGSTAGFKSRAFAPNVLFAQGEQGFWYDPSDIPVNWRRNLLTYTEQFDNAAWIKVGLQSFGSGSIANATTAPDGTITADLIVEDTSTGAHRAYQNYVAPSSTEIIVFSVYAKAYGSRTQFGLYHSNSTLGVFTLTGNGTASGTGASITNVGNGWYRCVMAKAAPDTANRSYIIEGYNGSSTSYTGDGTSGIYVWGAQLERASTASDYQRIVTPEISFLDYQPQPVMYTDSAGTTPVTAVEQAVGLILDKSKGLVLGPELVVNGNPFDTAGWSIGAGWVISSGVATATNGALLSRTAGLQSGKTYLITVVVSARTSGSLFVSPGGVTYSAAITAAGTYTYRLTQSGGNAFIYLDGGSTFNGTVSSLSVREIAGNHAIQPGATNRPTLRARYNLLTYSEQFDNADWVKNASAVATNSTTAPDGTSTADTLTANAGTGTIPRVGNTAISLAASMAHVASIYVKPLTHNFLQIYINNQGADWANFTLTGDGVASANGATTATIQKLGDWYRCSMSYTTGASTDRYPLFMLGASGSATRAQAWNPVGTEAFYIWGADVRRSNDTYLPYQRIAAATDYDTVGFPPYLAFDGSDDSLYTGGSIDFSATDKMTVWAGVTKLSDVGAATIVGYNANYTSAPGFEVMSPGFNGSPEYFIGASSTVAGAFYGLKTGFASPLTSTLAASFDITNPTNTDRLKLRVDAAEQALTTAGAGLQPGTFGAAVLYIGRRGNTNLPLNGRIYSLIGRGAATSAALIQQAERWVASKQGRTL